jgi:hypothetical protein
MEKPKIPQPQEKKPQEKQPQNKNNKNHIRGFAGIWTATGPVYFYNTKTGNVKLEQQSIVLSITKFTDKIYFGTFTELSPTPGVTFNFVANQSTENPNLIQAATSGLNSFYFTEKEGYNVLNVSFNGSIAVPTFGENVVIAANLKFARKCDCL